MGMYIAEGHFSAVCVCIKTLWRQSLLYGAEGTYSNGKCTVLEPDLSSWPTPPVGQAP